MTFILGVGIGVLLTIGFALLSFASDADDEYDSHLDECNFDD